MVLNSVSNRVRVEKVLKNKSTKPKKLALTDDSFMMHLLRCTYQLLVWKGCMSAKLSLLNRADFGYFVDVESGLFVPRLMTQPPAPPELLSDLVCSCLDNCCDNCICCSSEQPCTQACECQDQNCNNIFTFLAIVPDETD